MPIRTRKRVQRKNHKTKRARKRPRACPPCPPGKTFETFEDKIEEHFKKNNIDFASANYDLEKELIKNLHTAVSPSDITPRDDFYSYINERWLKDFQIDKGQEYIVQVDNFRLTQDKVYHELLVIVNDYINASKRSAHATRMKNFYSSMLEFNSNAQSLAYANVILSQIDDHIASPSGSGVWDLLGYINTIDIISWGAPFVVSTAPDDKKPTVTRCYINSPKFTLTDLNLYFDDGTNVAYKKRYVGRYFTYLRDLFENVFGKNHGFDVQDVFDVEVKLLYSIGCDDEDKRSSADNYNVVTSREAVSHYGFDWPALSAAMGFRTPPEKFVTSNLNFLTCGSRLLKAEWNTPKWRTYWIYLFIRQEQRFNKRGLDTHFAFHGKYVTGQQQQMDRNLMPVFGLGYAYNEYLSTEYIKKHSNPSINQYVNVMALDLKTVFTRIITRNKWFEPKTKRKALEKLAKMKMQIGEPPFLVRDPVINYAPDDAWGNLLKVSLWRHDHHISRVGRAPIDLPSIDWSVTPVKFVGTQSYVVNASYTANENKIYVPTGYLQAPFVDLDERGIEYNLAHVGFTLGHEMSHALDDWGSTYDADGVMHNWWTDADRKRFKRIQVDITKQYEALAKQDGLDFDASISTGENLADISGLTICREYLRDFQLKNSDILPIQNISFEAFFVYFAFQQRQRIHEKSLTAQLKTNPHPLDKYRTNAPLSRLPIFRAMYDIKKGDKMWWPSTSRVWED